MRVLFTGARSSAGGHVSKMTIYESDSSVGSLLRFCEHIGHDIEIRHVDPGENLDDFDLVVCTTTDCRVWGTKHFYGAIWAMIQSWTGGPPCIANFDHWTIRDIVKSHMVMFVKPEKLWDGFIQYEGRDRALKYRDLYVEQFRRIAEDGDWGQKLVCAWPWGDHSLLTKDTNLLPFEHVFDPTALHHHPQPGRYELERYRRWVYGSWAHNDRWLEKQKLRWPVDRYGLPKQGMVRLTRDDLVREYLKCWGGICAPYYHVGSGYWRARYVHHAYAKCITLADSREVPPTGFLMPKPREIERMSDTELDTLAGYQKDAFDCAHTSRFDLCEQLDGIFWDVANRPRIGDRPHDFLRPEPSATRLFE